MSTPTTQRRARAGRPDNDTIQGKRARDLRWLLLSMSGLSLADIAAGEPEEIDRSTISRGIAAARRRAGEGPPAGPAAELVRSLASLTTRRRRRPMTA